MDTQEIPVKGISSERDSHSLNALEYIKSLRPF